MKCKSILGLGLESSFTKQKGINPFLQTESTNNRQFLAVVTV